MAPPRLVACASCGCYALATEALCPHCDAPLRKPDGSFEVTKVATFLGIAALAIPLACSSSASSSGAGGEGGDGTTGTGGSATSNSTASTVTSSTTTTVPTSTTSTYAAGITTSSSGSCDNSGDCGDSTTGCIVCSLGGNCSDVYEACVYEQDCVDYSGCINACGDQACKDQCAAAHPTGVDIYTTLLVCILCEECYNDCQGASAGCP